MKYVVTGATGFIGARLVEKLSADGAEVCAVVRPNSKNTGRLPKGGGLRVVECDISDYRRLPEMIGSADIFYHLAWEGTRAPQRDDAEIQRGNYVGAVDAWNAAEALDCSVFLCTGSQAECGKITGAADESLECHPITEYGRQKLHALETLTELSERSSMRLVWARVFSLYGERDFENSLISSAVRKMLNDQPIEMTAATQLWDYLYVGDAVDALISLTENAGCRGIYNLANGNYRPLREFVEEMKTVLDSKSELIFGAVPYRSEGAVSLTPNVDRLKATGWRPAVTFADGILNIAKSIS